MAASQKQVLPRSRTIQRASSKSVNNSPEKSKGVLYLVYILVSQKDIGKFYIGFTENLDRRLSEHNSASTVYSKRYAPWRLSMYICFEDRSKVYAFEQYLKSGSGFAFLKKRLN